MLTVRIELHCGVITGIYGVAEAGPQRTTDAQIERQTERDRPVGSGDIGRPVGRTVVDHHDVELRKDFCQFRKDAGERHLFVECRDDYKNPDLSSPSRRAPLRRLESTKISNRGHFSTTR